MNIVPALLTLPGLAMHLTLQWFACRLFRLSMESGPSLKSGRLRHEPARRLPFGLAAALMPSVCQLVLGVGAMGFGLLSLYLDRPESLAPLYLWVGVTLFIQGFPAERDSRDLLARTLQSVLAWPLIPFVAVPLLIGAGRRYGVHYVLGCALAAGGMLIL